MPSRDPGKNRGVKFTQWNLSCKSTFSSQISCFLWGVTFYMLSVPICPAKHLTMCNEKFWFLFYYYKLIDKFLTSQRWSARSLLLSVIFVQFVWFLKTRCLSNHPSNQNHTDVLALYSCNANIKLISVSSGVGTSSNIDTSVSGRRNVRI